MLGHRPVRQHLQTEENPQHPVDVNARAKIDGAVKSLLNVSSAPESDYDFGFERGRLYQLASIRIVTVKIQLPDMILDTDGR